MPFGFFGARFDVQEFILGLVIGFVLFTLVRRSKPAFFTFYEWLRNRGEAVVESLTSSSEEPYFLELQFKLDGLHLANPLFPFQEILIPPRLLIPPPLTDPIQEEQSDELYHSILPTVPDWNALESIYQSPSLPITHFLDSDESVFITGELGSGKTSALIFLAQECLTRISQDPKAKNKIPIYLHACDLDLSRKATKDPLTVVIETVRKTSSIGLASFLTRYLRLHLQDNPGLILLDGLDELTEEEIRPIHYWVSDLRENYPQHQIIAVGAPREYNGILKAGLFPVSIAPWNNYDLDNFLNKWANAWHNHVVPLLPKDRVAEIDPVLLNSWIRVSNVGYSPLEVTMKVWSFYVGDTQGSTLENAVQAFIRRMLSPNEQHAAQAIGLSWIRSRRSTFSSKSFEKRAPLQDLFEANILRRQNDDLIKFVHPSIGAFLAAGGMLIAKKISFNPFDFWEPNQSALRFYAGLADASHLVNRCMQETDDQLHSSLLTCVSWLARSKPDTAWRNQVLSAMAKVFQDDRKPYGLRLRILQALTAANEQSAKALFKRMLQSKSVESRTLGVIGIGGLRNSDYINDLKTMIERESNDNIRFAACLALAAIGNMDALKILGQFLLSGDDASQIFASLALSTHAGEGVPMLLDAVEMENVRVRRAAIFGLGRVQRDSVIELLQKIRLEDDQTIVQNAAADILEARLSPQTKFSFLADEISSLPWLISYAAKQGLGVTPGKGALEILRRVFLSGDQLEKIAALEAVGLYYVHELTLETTQALNDDDPLIRHASFEALWRLNAVRKLTISSKQPIPSQ